MKTMPTAMKVAMTHPGVKIGLQAGSSCCVNLEYLGFLEILLDESEVPSWGPPELLAAPLLDIFTHTHTQTPTPLCFLWVKF